MNRPPKPMRSVLYIPGVNARALDKGRNLPSDALILDLEDAVSPGQKQQARDDIFRALSKGGYDNKVIAIRINGLDTEWGQDDLDMALSSSADAIVLPKVDSVAPVHQVEQKIVDNKTIWAMIETPLGVLNIQDIARSSSKLSCLVMGTSDLAKEIQCAHTSDRIPFMTSFGLCILAARAYGLSILDGVHLNLADDDGFLRACRQGVELGFDGKTLIHPKTIEAANSVFAPTREQVEEAKTIIRAHREAEQKGIGVVVVNGKLIENLHVDMARHMLALDEVIRNT